MHPPRVAPLALLATMAIGLAACASSAAEEAVRAQVPATTAPASTAPASTAPATTAPATAAPAATPPAALAAPVDDSADAPAPTPAATPAVIEIRYTGDPSQQATASIEGPDGVRRAAVDDVASFDGLRDGSYEVTISFESQPTAARDGVDIGTAYSAIDAGTLTVVAGDHGVVTCDTESCTAVL